MCLKKNCDCALYVTYKDRGPDETVRNMQVNLFLCI